MPTPLRVVLHIFQIIFLLFALLCFALVAIEMFGYNGNYTWDAQDEMMAIMTPTAALLAIGFSPGLWSVAQRSKAPGAPAAPPMQPAFNPQPYTPQQGPPPVPQQGQGTHYSG